ncbi:hypothetical protein IU433_28825 [Nocardia puris]|uniref:Uncharacterized protein n=1 Tax=Nocardia puris TaxID=208602 RepID=A0A366D2U9_9NOCA|nr:hypothetical protein [Nocardia puris]MBF6213884.1 hypothetical protein [Nocardia puris]MBF6368523.1 hypothetical protein [Nocardia puris]MBF6463010.1 hypothetical protein [Nocardia puris]RBO84245.1 hypothetical protein DFR74_11764 [Nocardia puris]
MRAICTFCESAVDHCHGTLVVHPTGRPECTDDTCPDPDHARHAFVIDCTDIAGGCACAAEEARRSA